MQGYHSPHHWIPVAIVVAIALLTLTDAHGQRTDAAAPSPPQAAASAQRQDPGRRQDVAPRDRDSGVAKEQRSVAQRAKDAVRRIVQRSRHGVSDRDVDTAQH